MALEEDPPASAPAWVLTYADMMTLLLTFFVMIVSMSEIRKDDRFQGAADSLEQHFGGDTSQNSLSTGGFKPRNTTTAALMTAGRWRRKQVVNGGPRTKTPHPVTRRDEATHTAESGSLGVVLPFTDDSTTLDSIAMERLHQAAERFRGKPQIIEICGRASYPTAASSGEGDSWDLSYARAREVMRLLIEEHELEPDRMRISMVGPNDPTPHLESASTARSRVELYLRKEIANSAE
jgi:chemotaxis protein MotB